MKKLSYYLIGLLLTTSQMANAAGLVVHEWGTFTSVQGSDGKSLEGMQHEEEALPYFVYNIDQMMIELSTGIPQSFTGRCSPGCRACIKGYCEDGYNDPVAPQPTRRLVVKQKMETPVMYFYSDKPAEVSVSVSFPQGIISQFFPKPTAYTPVLHGQAMVETGSITYDHLKILTQDALVPQILGENIYLPARETKSNLISSNGENEKFIFYRGLGNFVEPFSVRSEGNRLFLQNDSIETVEHALALNISQGKGAFVDLGSIHGGFAKSIALDETLKQLTPSVPLAQLLANLQKKFVSDLVQSGLYEDEANAMFNTWKKSYFQNDGLRVLYILPRAETDRILPLTINVKSAKVVRSIVGRVEVMTNVEEQSILSQLQTSFEKSEPGDSEVIQKLGRFAEPKLRRALAIANDSALKTYIQRLVDQASN